MRPLSNDAWPAARLECDLDDDVRAFAADVARDLLCVPKRLQPKYLYDDLGSSLFGAICHLPWYRITRAEKELLRQHREAIAASTRPRVRLIELGCGTGEKLRVLAEGFLRCRNAAEVHLVDVSQLALDQTMHALSRNRTARRLPPHGVRAGCRARRARSQGR